MKSINEITKFLRMEKEEWERSDGVVVSLKDIKTKLSHKASNWITFQDGSGEIRIYEEGSIPYSTDLDVVGVGRDVLLGGTALLIPVVGTWIAAGIVGSRGGKIISTAAFTELAWRNTYIFVFNASSECVFAMELHYPKGDYFIKETLRSIEHAVKDLEQEMFGGDDTEQEYDDEYSEYEDDEYSEQEYENDE